MEKEIEKLNTIVSQLKEQEDLLSDEEKKFLYTELGTLITGLNDDVNS